MFRMSLTLVNLLNISGVSPERLNSAMDQRIKKSMGAMVCVDHFPRLITAASKVAVLHVRRRHRRFLVELEYRGCRYIERSRTDCVLTVPGELPELAQAAAPGREAGDIIDLADARAVFEGARVEGVIPSWSGSTAFELAPRWITFEEEGSVTRERAG